MDHLAIFSSQKATTALQNPTEKISKMLGFSRRRLKLGRLRGNLGYPPRSPARPARRLGHHNAENSAAASDSDGGCQCASSALDLDKCGLGSLENWAVLSIDGDKPPPRFHHAAAVVGSKMVIVGGESGNGLLDDTWILNMDKLAWVQAAPKAYLSPNGVSLKIPACKGSLGEIVLLIGGKTDPVSEKVPVWSFDVETECWSHIEAKGDIPVARSGHTVIRAGAVLILFGGEDAKGRKLNDLYMFDLKSLTWLPLHYTGTGPSPRSNHVAALYNDKTLLIFGGHSKSKILNDLYSLDFETIVWSRIKVGGHHPSPRAGCCGALCGTKWYIAGSGSKKKRYGETLIFYILKVEWSVSVTSPSSSITTNRGFSLVSVHHKENTFLVTFGGIKKEPSNQVELLVMVKNEHSASWHSVPDTDLLLFGNYPANTKEFTGQARSNASFCSVNSVGRQSLASALEQNASGRKSLSDSATDLDCISGSVSLRKQFDHDEDYHSAVKVQNPRVDDKCKDSEECLVQKHSSSQEDFVEISMRTEETLLAVEPESSSDGHKLGSNDIQPDSDHIEPPDTNIRSASLTNPLNIYQLYEIKIATLMKKNVSLEEQLAAAVARREAAEQNLSSFIKSKQDIERKLADTLREVEMLKEKLAGMELAQEEANSLSNIVHSENVRLEHDVAFLKAILDDTQKELHAMRAVLAGESARAFQLQVEVFHLKQRLQTMEHRAPTPRKPFHV